MLKVTPIGAGRDAVNYYAGLVRQARDDGAWEEKRQQGEGHVEDYYLASEDEGGRWWGQGTRALGVSGLGARDELEAIFAGTHPVSGEQLGQRPRPNTIRAYDLTFSAPKTVSLLASLGDSEQERAVIDAHESAVRATLALIEERTTTRAGHNGVHRLDIGGLAVLAVRHRTSRALDPQLHTHALVMARVQAQDGRWRALDATTMMRGVLAFGAIYQSALRSELRARFPGLRFGAVVKGQAEIEGLTSLAALFSKRKEQIERQYELELARWRERHPDRSPTLKEERQLRDRAALASRQRKQGARSLNALRTGWLEAARDLGHDAPPLIHEAIHPTLTASVPVLSNQQIAAEAIDGLSEERSVFSREHVERQVAMRIDDGKGRSAATQARAIEALAGQVIEQRCIDLVALGEEGPKRAVALAREPALERYTTPALLREEQALHRWLAAAAAQGGEPASTECVARAAAEPLVADENTPHATDEQVRAAALIAGSHRACVVIGPAGTGKTTTLKLAARVLGDRHHQVIVLTPWARAAAAVSESTGLPAENVRRYLTERSHDRLRPERRLRPGSTLIVDEAGTLATPDWRALIEVAQADRLRIVFVGDHRQLSAVGRGGMLCAARERLESFELARVYRFNAPWERAASRALRAGRADALEHYLAHDRVFSGALDQVQERMLSDWHETHRTGGRYAFCVPTREQAAYLCQRAQERLIAAGELDGTQTLETNRGESIHIGDLVATRENERRPGRVRGGPVRNREVWSVRAIDDDGSLTLQRGQQGRVVTVAPSYAVEHVELCYFQTVHGVQGHTVVRGGILVDELTGFRSLYVGMTRGRARNTAYVVREDEESARDVLERALLRDRADLGVLAAARELQALARRRLPIRATTPTESPSESATVPGRLTAIRRMPLTRDGRLSLGAQRLQEEPGLAIEP
jgi:conjugative relaxase-like TrwC/TraI family protein